MGIISVRKDFAKFCIQGSLVIKILKLMMSRVEDKK